MTDQDNKLSSFFLVRMLVIVSLICFLPVLFCGRWDWWEGWVFGIISFISFVIGRVLLAHRNPELLAERARFEFLKDVKPWDRILSPLTAADSLLVSLTAALDVRFGWSFGFGLPVQIVALLIILAATAFGTWALLENRFFTPMVPIQIGNGHKVVSTGPYRWVRHPGYAGSFWYLLAVPVFLSSAWAFLPAVFVITALIIRTFLEDRALQEELPGYREYAQRVRYRLVPGLW